MIMTNFWLMIIAISLLCISVDISNIRKNGRNY